MFTIFWAKLWNLETFNSVLSNFYFQIDDPVYCITFYLSSNFICNLTWKQYLKIYKGKYIFLWKVSPFVCAILVTSEVTTKGVLKKEVFLKIFQNSQEKTCVRVSFKLQTQACNFIKKETLEQVFSCEIWEILKNTFSQNTSGRLFL